MFRFARLIILCCAAFVTGVFYERLNAAEACDAAGGTHQDGICVGVQP
ncbi:MAG: hypothetical protein AAGF56_09060 [Pseudomonadota bacterium]